jgi:hypothetical protein
LPVGIRGDAERGVAGDQDVDRRRDRDPRRCVIGSVNVLAGGVEMCARAMSGVVARIGNRCGKWRIL